MPASFCCDPGIGELRRVDVELAVQLEPLDHVRLARREQEVCVQAHAADHQRLVALDGEPQQILDPALRGCARSAAMVRPFTPFVPTTAPFAVSAVCRNCASTSLRYVSPSVPSTTASKRRVERHRLPLMSRWKSGVCVVALDRDPLQLAAELARSSSRIPPMPFDRVQVCLLKV